VSRETTRPDRPLSATRPLSTLGPPASRPRPTPPLRFRRPTEADHAPLVRLADDWWGGRPVRRLLPRFWFRHFASTSWIAETDDPAEAATGGTGSRPGLPAGFLVGFVSPDRPDEAFIHLASTNPNLRRRGIGRALYERFCDDVRARGVVRVTTTVWPGDRVAVEFHRAIGFRAIDGPGTQPMYGVPAFPDYDAEGEDRAVFVRVLDPVREHDPTG